MVVLEFQNQGYTDNSKLIVANSGNLTEEQVNLKFTFDGASGTADLIFGGW